MFSKIYLNGITNMFSYIVEVRAVFYYVFLFSVYMLYIYV